VCGSGRPSCVWDDNAQTDGCDKRPRVESLNGQLRCYTTYQFFALRPALGAKTAPCTAIVVD